MKMLPALAQIEVMPPGTMLVTQLVLMTTFVLGLCGLIYWLGRRMNRRLPSFGGEASPVMRLVDTLCLEKQRTIHIVQVGEIRVSVSISSNGIDGISPLSTSFQKILQSTT